MSLANTVTVMEAVPPAVIYNYQSILIINNWKNYVKV